MSDADRQAGLFRTGDRFLKYEIRSLLGRGGHAFVYHGVDTFLGRDVAIKMIPSQKDHGRELMRRGQAEARFLAEFRHPNVVTVFDAGADDHGLVYIVMERLNGQTLREALRTHRRLAIEEVLLLVAQIADAVQAAHEFGVIHRDLKPDNVFITRNNTAKVLDFGIAKFLSPARLTTQRDLVHGTVLYMSPEHLQGLGVTAKSDVYALGTLAYEALLGCHPCLTRAEPPVSDELVWMQAMRVPEPLDQIDPTIPRYVARVVQRAISKRPEQRFPSMRAMAEAARAAWRRYTGERRAQGFPLAVRDLSEGSHPVRGSCPSPGSWGMDPPARDRGTRHGDASARPDRSHDGTFSAQGNGSRCDDPAPQGDRSHQRDGHGSSPVALTHEQKAPGVDTGLARPMRIVEAAPPPPSPDALSPRNQAPPGLPQSRLRSRSPTLIGPPAAQTPHAPSSLAAAPSRSPVDAERTLPSEPADPLPVASAGQPQDQKGPQCQPVLSCRGNGDASGPSAGRPSATDADSEGPRGATDAGSEGPRGPADAGSEGPSAVVTSTPPPALATLRHTGSWTREWEQRLGLDRRRTAWAAGIGLILGGMGAWPVVGRRFGFELGTAPAQAPLDSQRSHPQAYVSDRRSPPLSATHPRPGRMTRSPTAAAERGAGSTLEGRPGHAGARALEDSAALERRPSANSRKPSGSDAQGATHSGQQRVGAQTGSQMAPSAGGSRRHAGEAPSVGAATSTATATVKADDKARAQPARPAKPQASNRTIERAESMRQRLQWFDEEMRTLRVKQKPPSSGTDASE
ncbi:protein kinase [Myxococcota bacterium]